MDKVKAARSLIQEALAQSQNPCFTCSFQAEDVVVLHLLLKERPEIPVLFLDTGYHFPEVYAYRDELQKRLGFRLVNLTPLFPGRSRRGSTASSTRPTLAAAAPPQGGAPLRRAGGPRHLVHGA